MKCTSLALLVLLTGCVKTHYVFEMPNGELVAADERKAPPILARAEYVRYDVYRTRTCGGAKRAFKREYRDHGPVWASGPDADEPRAESVERNAALSINGDKPRSAASMRDEEAPRDCEAAAGRLLVAIQSRIQKAHWSREILVEAAEHAETLYPGLSDSTKGKLHAAIGLYACYASDQDLASREFRAAKQVGFHNHREVLPTCWTGGSISRFEAEAGGEP